jgi:hypothetical protein
MSSVAPIAARSFKNGSAEIATYEKVAPEKILSSFNTWAFKREQPADPQLMLQFISEAISLGEPVPFVLYWGKGPRCHLAEPDTKCLDYLAAFARRVREAYEPGAALKLIFTDTHAELNGHSQHSIRGYFAGIEVGARQRGFETCWLSQITQAAEVSGASDLHDDIAPEDTLLRLSASATRWYRGNGSPEEGALKYLEMNMIERRAVELAFPRSIFVTFNGSKMRGLFPKRLPIFYMYSLRRGKSIKPWFLPADTVACTVSVCQCTVLQNERADRPDPPMLAE